MPMATEARLVRVQETCAGGIRNLRDRALGILTVFGENHEEDSE